MAKKWGQSGDRSMGGTEMGRRWERWSQSLPRKDEIGRERGKEGKRREKRGKVQAQGYRKSVDPPSSELADAHPGETLEFPPQLVPLLGLD